MEPFSPFHPEFHANPYPTYHRYRTLDPVHLRGPGEWYVFRHADVVTVLRDMRFVRQRSSVFPEEYTTPMNQGGAPGSPYDSMIAKWMLFRDPPAHTRLRQLVRQAFTPRVIEQLRPRIQQIADELLAIALKAGGMDLIGDFAFPLPVTVIAEMLGVPIRDREQFKAWSAPLAAGLDDRSYKIMAEADQAATALTAYLREIVARRRRAPQDDLISGLIAAEEKGDRLSEEELLAMCVLLLVAGHETTVNLIGNGMFALFRHPDQLQLLRENPALMENAVEELLRYDGPVQLTSRQAAVDFELGGKLIRRGDWVNVVLGSANRDPAVFHDPDRLNVMRAPKQHLSFGHGIHYCIGAPLARLEGQIAFATLLGRLPHLRLQTDEPQWRPSLVFRGLRALPVAF